MEQSSLPPSSSPAMSTLSRAEHQEGHPVRQQGEDCTGNMYGSDEHPRLICEELRPKGPLTRDSHIAFWEGEWAAWGQGDISLSLP